MHSLPDNEAIPKTLSSRVLQFQNPRFRKQETLPSSIIFLYVQLDKVNAKSSRSICALVPLYLTSLYPSCPTCPCLLVFFVLFYFAGNRFFQTLGPCIPLASVAFQTNIFYVKQALSVFSTLRLYKLICKNLSS